MKLCTMIVALCVVPAVLAQGQPQAAQSDKPDSVVTAKIRDEGMNRSQIMDILSTLTDVYGPRLAGSPAYRAAAAWAVKKLDSIGLSNPHLEGWGPWGKGWTLKHYDANVMGRQVWPLISYPAAWSPPVSKTAEVVLFDAKTDSAIDTFRGKLRGKFVMMSDPREVKPPFEAEAIRDADSTLLKLANADAQRPRGFRFNMQGDFRKRAIINYHKMLLCQEEGAAGILTASRGDDGNVFVQGASIVQNPDSMRMGGGGMSVYSAGAPKILPQFSVGAEHYNRLVRMLGKGDRPKLAINYEAEFTKTDSCFNIIAEIPGSDLADEVVMIGGHFDSWQGGTGATDNGTGSAVCIEAMRILKALDLHPRRTIRIGLWDAEEEGLLGSRAYVTKHFGSREGSASDPASKVTLLPEANKFDVYFNNDNGAGKVRGIYMQGNEQTRPIFRAWLAPFTDMGASTVTPSNTGGTDHQSFDGVGLPGFQFIQDELDYDTRTHHSTMDLFDRVPPEDVKQAAVIMASFAYNAAMRDQPFPRKPLPQPRAN
jgi:carboxypeptidase Q